MSTADEYREELAASGYTVKRAPDMLAHVTDADVARRSSCDECGHHGLEYEPWTRANGRGYRALAICPECGHATEF